MTRIYGNPVPVSPIIINKIKTRLDGAKQRCYNPKNRNYSHYGGRGIKICQRWLNSPDSFVEWALKNGYSPELTIERKNVDKGYTPDNCTWIKPEEQYWNRTDTVTDRKNSTRICQICKEEKPLIAYHKNKSKPLGRHYVCKKCRATQYKKATE